jgi:hypothetical protein
MVENLNPAASPAQVPQESRMGFLQRLTGAYLSPQKTFDDIGRNGGWLGIFLIVAALIVASSYVLQSRMDHETYMRKALQMSPLTKKLPEEQIKAIVERPQSPVQRYIGFATAPIAVLVVYVICAAVLLLVFVIMGGALNFKRSLAVTIWGMAPPGIVAMLLGIMFMFIKDPDSLEIDVSSNVVSNLGLLVSDKDHPALASLLSSIDLFSFWSIFLLSMGFSAAAEGKLPRNKALTGVIAVWAIYVLGKVGFKAIF